MDINDKISTFVIWINAQNTYNLYLLKNIYSLAVGITAETHDSTTLHFPQLSTTKYDVICFSTCLHVGFNFF